MRTLILTCSANAHRVEINRKYWPVDHILRYDDSAEMSELIPADLFVGGDSLNPGQYRCTISHIRLWQDVKLNGPAVIMEDDAVPLPNVYDSKKIQTLLERYEVVILWAPKMWTKEEPGELGEIPARFLTATLPGSVAYAVNSKGAAFLLAHYYRRGVYRVDKPIDVITAGLIMQGPTAVCCLTPCPVVHTGHQSTIANQ